MRPKHRSALKMRHIPKLADETHIMKVKELYRFVFRTVVI